jgi:hypothetical protein
MCQISLAMMLGSAANAMNSNFIQNAGVWCNKCLWVKFLWSSNFGKEQQMLTQIFWSECWLFSNWCINSNFIGQNAGRETKKNAQLLNISWSVCWLMVQHIQISWSEVLVMEQQMLITQIYWSVCWLWCNRCYASNFFGSNAGYSATGANASNFLVQVLGRSNKC